MSDDIFRTPRRADPSATLARLGAWLRRRPNESWLFLFAGIVVGAILG